MKITNDIFYIGTDDRELDLFESQYIIPNGVSYNSYVIMDEKITVMDTVDERVTEKWIENLENVLQGRKPEYLVVSHMEPDHSGSIEAFMKKYPDTKIIMNQKTVGMFGQFIHLDIADKTVLVKEGEKIELGSHELTFIMAPMVHWPEVMFSYDSKDKVLFSADAFGKFGAFDTDEDWACEARRYYFNIVGKYGAQVQMALKKLAELDIQIIAPLHGPVLTENLGYYIDKYNTWSSYIPENEGVLIAYGSIHGNTGKAADKLAQMLENKGVEKVVVSDLSREDMAEVIEDAFRYDRIVLACATYDGGIFPCMDTFLSLLKSKNYQKRKVGFIENGTWAPMTARLMKTKLEGLKELTMVEPVVTMKSVMNEETEEQLMKLAEALAKNE